MPNDICLNIPQPNSSLNLDLNTAPPPYSTEFDGFNSLVGHLQHTHLAEQQQASPEPVEVNIKNKKETVWTNFKRTLFLL